MEVMNYLPMFGNLCNQYSNVTHSGPVGLPAGSNKWEFAVSSVCYDLRWGGGGCGVRVYLPVSNAGSGQLNLVLEGFPRFNCVGCCTPCYRFRSCPSLVSGVTASPTRSVATEALLSVKKILMKT